MTIKELEIKLNKEYELLGIIKINKISEASLEHTKIMYIEEIMNKIEPTNNDEPIVVARNYSDDYKLIDGYHRLKFHKENNTNINAIILEEYQIDRNQDTFLSFMEKITGKTICFIEDYIIMVNDSTFYIEPNEGCGGCSNGWSSLNVLPEFIGKKINVKKVESKSEDEESDTYSLYINDKLAVEVDTGWGNGYYGGDFKIKLTN